MENNHPILASVGTKMPTLFIPHGAGPCFFMDWSPADTWQPLAAFLRGVAQTLPARPRAIVLVSAHWLAPEFRLTGQARPPLIFDYSGFPAHTYELTYPSSCASVWWPAAWRPASTASVATTMAFSSRSN